MSRSYTVIPMNGDVRQGRWGCVFFWGVNYYYDNVIINSIS